MHKKMQEYIASVSSNLGNVVLLKAHNDKKCPITAGWTSRTESDMYYPNWTNYAMVTGSVSNVWVFDIDNKDNNKNNIIDWLLENDYDPDDGFTVETPSGGLHLYFKYDPRISNIKHFRQYNDIQSDGQCVIFIGSKYLNGIYKNGKLTDYPTNEYTLVADNKIRKAPKFLIDAIINESVQDIQTQMQMQEDNTITAFSEKETELLILLNMLDSKYYTNYEYWNRIGIIIYNELGIDGLKIYDLFSQKSEDKYDGIKSVERKMNSFKSNPNKRLTIASLHRYAKECNSDAYNDYKMNMSKEKKESKEQLKQQLNQELRNELSEVFSEFEKTHCKVISSNVYIRHENNKIHLLSQKVLREMYCHIEFPLKEGKRFIDQWIIYPDIRRYDTMDVYPDKSQCPENCFNLWTDFYGETITNYIEMPKERDLILKHITIICGNDQQLYDYVVGWIANMIQYPDMKSTMLTFYAKQGSGKGCFLKLLERMIGSDKYFSTAHPERDVYGSFNPSMSARSLVNLDEMEKKQAIDADGKIKNLITEGTITINKKMMSQYVEKSFHHFIITTNNLETIKITEDDRRNVLIESSNELIGNKEYFTKLFNMLDDDNVIKTMYEYFKSIDTPKVYLNVDRPMTTLKRDLTETCKSRYELWLSSYAIGKTGLIEEFGTQCYSSFKSFCENNKMAINEISSVKFGIYISRLPHVTKKHTKVGVKYVFDMDAINGNINSEKEPEDIGNNLDKLVQLSC
jgi:hypothetical protein